MSSSSSEYSSDSSSDHPMNIDSSTHTIEPIAQNNRVMPRLLPALPHREPPAGNINFIQSDEYIGEKKGMKFFLGPWGLGYYTEVHPNIIWDAYQTKIKNFNHFLTKTQKDEVHLFLKNLVDFWTKREIEFFFEVLGISKKFPGTDFLLRAKSLCKDMCPICLNIINDKNERKKCISFECDGMCSSCKDNIEECCPVCNAKQELKCPICLETRPLWATKVLNCGHGICWKCFAVSFEKAHNLINCPKCRKAI